MYESPINIIYKNVEESFENGIIKAVQKADIIVDKEELIKALQYDRDQYRKGYADAKYRSHGEWVDKWHTLWKEELPMCSVCNNISVFKSNYCPNCGADMRKEVEA